MKQFPCKLILVSYREIVLTAQIGFADKHILACLCSRDRCAFARTEFTFWMLEGRLTFSRLICIIKSTNNGILIIITLNCLEKEVKLFS